MIPPAMASQYTHLSVGRAALAAVPEASRSAAARSAADPRAAGPSGPRDDSACRDADLRTAFALGCQGPDLFYHAQRTRPSGLHFGSLAHKRGYGVLAAALALRAARIADPDDAAYARAYALGFSTHAAVDRITHPFVVYRSGRFNPVDPSTYRWRSCHVFYERVLDACLARAEGLPDMTSFRQTELLSFPGDAAPPFLVDILSGALADAYPSRAADDPLLGQRVVNALSDASFFHRLTDPSTIHLVLGAADSGGFLDDEHAIRRISTLYPPRLPDGLDFANEAHAEWLHPCRPEERSTASWFDLVAEAKLAAAKALSAVWSLMNGTIDAAEAARRVGDGSLNAAAADGAPAPVVATAPLPLPELMERELARYRSGRARD